MVPGLDVPTSEVRHGLLREVRDHLHPDPAGGLAPPLDGDNHERRFAPLELPAPARPVWSPPTQVSSISTTPRSFARLRDDHRPPELVEQQPRGLVADTPSCRWSSRADTPRLSVRHEVGGPEPARARTVPVRQSGSPCQKRARDPPCPALPSRRPKRLHRARGARDPRRPAQRRDRRPRRPRQDHARRCAPPPDRVVPRQPGGRGARDGLDGPRAREGHHDPRQADQRRLRRDPHQHRGHPRPRRLRGRGGALAQPGRLGAAARRRRGGTAAPDALRPPEGDGPPPAGGRGGQQDRSRRRAPGGGARRHLRAVHGPGRGRPPDRVPGRLHERAGRHGDPGPGGARHQPPAAPGAPRHGHPAAHVHAGPSAPAAGDEPVGQRVRRADGRRPAHERHGSGSASGSRWCARSRTTRPASSSPVAPSRSRAR